MSDYLQLKRSENQRSENNYEWSLLHIVFFFFLSFVHGAEVLKLDYPKGM